MKRFRIILWALLVYFFLVFLLYIAEHNNPNSNINSYVDAIWFTIMTLTGEPTASTGAQDFYPATFVGQVLGMLFVISSLGLLGFVIGDMSAILSERREHNRLGHRGINFENHVIILGWDAFAKDIVSVL